MEHQIGCLIIASFEVTLVPLNDPGLCSHGASRRTAFNRRVYGDDTHSAGFTSC
jgi:hypothetical protein